MFVYEGGKRIHGFHSHLTGAYHPEEVKNANPKAFGHKAVNRINSTSMTDPTFYSALSRVNEDFYHHYTSSVFCANEEQNLRA